MHSLEVARTGHGKTLHSAPCPRLLVATRAKIVTMHKVVLALCLYTASAFGTRGGSARGLTKMSATAMSQDELKKQVGYQAIDDYVRSRVPGGAPRGSAPRAPRRPTTGPAHP